MRVIDSDRFRGPRAASLGGSGGGGVDDILKRLSALLGFRRRHSRHSAAPRDQG